MSYDVELIEPVSRQCIDLGFTHRMAGGTFAIGGTSMCELNITYNYSRHFYRVLDTEAGLRKLYGMTGAESIPLLDKAIDALKDDVSENYWEATEGNAKRALTQLRAFAYLRPDGIWQGD